MKLDQVKACGRFKGQKELIKHLEGKRLTGRQAMLAKCYECMGGYADGAYDCRIPDCPNYPKMPYRGKTATLCCPDPPNPMVLAGDPSRTSANPEINI